MTLPLFVVAVYFVVLAFIGWQSARLTTSDQDYWIAGGKLGWWLGGATLAATHASAGSFFGTIGVIHTTGWSFTWIVLSLPVAYWFMAAVLAPRFIRERELTLPAFLERRYASKWVRGIGAAIILIATVVYIQAQILAGGLIAQVILGIPARQGMIIFTVILILYTMIGGMIAVVYTDLVQLVVMSLGAVLAVPLAIRQTGGFERLLEHAQRLEPETFSWSGLPPTLLFTMAIAFTLGSISTPDKLVRLYAMRDLPTIRRGVLLAMVAATGLNLMLFLVALSSRVLFPVLQTGDLAMPMVARSVLPPFLGALLLAAILAAMMSTVDSLLIVAGSALAHDIWGTLVDPDVGEKRRVTIARVGVVVSGVAPLLLILSGVGEGELVQFVVLLFTALMASSFFAPVVLGVLWRRANRQGALAAMVGGVTTAFLWKAFGSASIDPVFPGFLVSTALLVTVSLATPPPPESAVAPYFDR